MYQFYKYVCIKLIKMDVVHAVHIDRYFWHHYLVIPFRPFFHVLLGFANPIKEVRTNFAPNGPPIWSPVSTVLYPVKPLFTLTTSKPPPTSSKTAPSKWSTGSSPLPTTPSPEVPFVLSNCPTFPLRLRKAHLRISKQWILIGYLLPNHKFQCLDLVCAIKTLKTSRKLTSTLSRDILWWIGQ